MTSNPPITSNPSITSPRPFRRSSSNKMLGGVAGGLGEYLSVDPTLVRLGAVGAVILSGGTAVLAYIALVIVTPTDTWQETSAA